MGMRTRETPAHLTYIYIIYKVYTYTSTGTWTTRYLAQTATEVFLHCPQNIDIPAQMQRIDQFVEQLKRHEL